jgi:hypothetical protein
MLMFVSAKEWNGDRVIGYRAYQQFTVGPGALDCEERRLCGDTPDFLAVGALV